MRVYLYLPVIALIVGVSVAVANQRGMAAVPDQVQLVEKAFEYGLPIFEEARLVYAYSYNPENPQRVPVNSFGHRRVLADHTARTVTTPNNDTLYSSAALDLSQGPVRLEVPDFGARYFSITFIDAYTNNFAHLGTRSGGGKGGSYVIVGPAWKGELTASIVQAPSNHIVAIARIAVDAPAEYDTIHALQDALRLTPTGPSPERYNAVQPKTNDAENFVAIVNQVLQDDPPPAVDAGTLSSFASVGIGAGITSLTPAQRDLWRQQFPALRAKLLATSKQAGRQVAGWQYTPPDIGDFGTDYHTRAIVALKGLLADIPAEITYSVAVADRNGARLDGSRRYRLHLPQGAPPSSAFWSLSMYEVTKEGALFFGDNLLRRYAIGDHAPGLVRNPDGSLDIFIQKARPDADRESNWLPIPAQDFTIIARVYVPGSALLDGTFRYPGLEPLD